MLAIVIPYFKISFFKETLNSLANQTNKNFNVYIGDDASKENPAALLEEFKCKIDITYHRFKENLGGLSLTKQWDRCISIASDERWVMVLGDDDYVSHNLVEEFYKHLFEIEKLNIKVIHFAVQKVYIGGKPSRIYQQPKIENAADNFFRKYFGDAHGSLSEHIFLKDAYSNCGFRDIPLAWGSDDLAWLDFTEFGDIYGINNATVYFRMSSENISREGYKSELKRETKYNFFKSIIENDLKRFNQDKRLKLILHYQSYGYRYRKVSVNFLNKICFLLLKERAFLQIYKSIRKYVRYIVKQSLFNLRMERT